MHLNHIRRLFNVRWTKPQYRRKYRHAAVAKHQPSLQEHPETNSPCSLFPAALAGPDRGGRLSATVWGRSQDCM